MPERGCQPVFHGICAFDDNRRFFTEIGEQCGAFRAKKRQIFVRKTDLPSGREIVCFLVQLFSCLRRFGAGALRFQDSQKFFPRFRRRQDLPCGRDLSQRNHGLHALAFDVKSTHAINFIPEKLNPYGG